MDYDTVVDLMGWTAVALLFLICLLIALSPPPLPMGTVTCPDAVYYGPVWYHYEVVYQVTVGETTYFLPKDECKFKKDPIR